MHFTYLFFNMCLSQINQFFSEVSGFVRSCCDQYPGHEMHEEGCIALEDQVIYFLELNSNENLLMFCRFKFNCKFTNTRLFFSRWPKAVF